MRKDLQSHFFNQEIESSQERVENSFCSNIAEPTLSLQTIINLESVFYSLKQQQQTYDIISSWNVPENKQSSRLFLKLLKNKQHFYTLN